MNIWASVGKSTAAQVAVTVSSGVLGLISARLIISHFGVATYEQYGLLASLPSLIPFADLGIAAIIVNTVAGSATPRTDPEVHRVITSSLRLLLLSGFVIAAMAVLLLATGSWPTVLGEALLPQGPMVATACVLLLAARVPVAIAQRLLIALGRNHIHAGTQLLIAPVVILGIVVAVATGWPGGEWLPIFTYVGGLLAAALGLALAAKALQPQVWRAICDVPRRRQVPGVSVFRTTWPMLVQMVALPIALQSGRVVLSHRGATGELAAFNLASQLFTVVVTATAMAGTALWPWFAQARGRGGRQSPWVATAIFSVVGLATAGLLALISPWAVELVSHGKISLSPLLVGSFVLYLVLQAAKYPTGMYMTDQAGLRFQIAPIIVMIPVTVGISWWLAPSLGASAPVLASALAVLLCQLLPNAWWVRRDLRTMPSEQPRSAQ